MRIQPFGEQALLVSFGDEISDVVNDQVINLYHSLKLSEQFTFLVPSYASLTVGIDRTKFTIQEATLKVQELSRQEISNSSPLKRKVVIPVCYSKEYGLDLESVCQEKNLDQETLINLHTETTYKVYMLGFVAGFAYLGTTATALNISRKEEPRKAIPAGSVGLAGRQTGIYPVEAPGGWQIIGRTPLNMFDVSREQPNLLAAGDNVVFKSISEDEFKLIALKVETGIYKMEVENV